MVPHKPMVVFHSTIGNSELIGIRKMKPASWDMLGQLCVGAALCVKPEYSATVAALKRRGYISVEDRTLIVTASGRAAHAYYSVSDARKVALTRQDGDLRLRGCSGYRQSIDMHRLPAVQKAEKPAQRRIHPTVRGI